MTKHIHIHIHRGKSRDVSIDDVVEIRPVFSNEIIRLWNKYSNKIDQNLPDQVIKSLSRGAQSSEQRFYNDLIKQIKKEGLDPMKVLPKLTKYYQ